MRDYTEFETTPCEEDCVQLGDPDYSTKVREEFSRLKKLIIEKFGNPQAFNCDIKLKANSHDFGVYHSMALYYDDECPKGLGYMMALEDYWPKTWDDNEKVDVVEAVLEEAE